MKKILLLLSFLVFTTVQYAQLSSIQPKSIFDCLYLSARELKPLIESGEVDVTETRHGVNIIEYLVLIFPLRYIFSARHLEIIELISQTNAELLDMYRDNDLDRLNTFALIMQECGYAISQKKPDSCFFLNLEQLKIHEEADFLWEVFNILVKYKKKISSREVITCLNCFESTRMLPLLIAHNADISSYDSLYEATPLEYAKGLRDKPDAKLLLEDALKKCIDR